MNRLAPRSLSWILFVPFCVFCGHSLLSLQSAEPAYDVLIRGGKIVDGSGNPWYKGDVAISGRRIVALGQLPGGAAARTIDATGLVVAPGFIDIHAHSDFNLLEDGSAQSKVR